MGSGRHYVQKIPFKVLSIGGYEDLDIHTVQGQIWIQSLLGAAENHGDVWYCLRTPSKEYARYHRSFLWVANFTKHVLDFMRYHKRVTLSTFEHTFHLWLEKIHGSDTSFKDWTREYGDFDYRRAIIAHSKYILEQSLQLGYSHELHPIWGEVSSDPKQLSAVIQQQTREQGTVVTPFVYRCFKDLAFSQFLRPQEPQQLAGNAVGWLKPNRVTGQSSSAKSKTQTAGDISEGDVVKVARDHSRDSRWRDEEPFWYAYVQRVTGKGLRVIWLDAPAHTTCSTMHYPETQELFFTDHCNCDQEHGIPIDEVISKTSVSFFGGPENVTTEFFIRQRFSREYSTFTDLKAEHFHCMCGKSGESKMYEKGNTVLVMYSESENVSILEPVELMGSVRSGVQDIVRVRRLLRKSRDFGDRDAEPNELVYSHVFEEVLVEKIVRPCLVRFYKMEDRANRTIPAPYCRYGTADAYYIIFEQSVVDLGLRPMTIPSHLSSLKQGFDPCEKPPVPKLKGLDLFCGGGNFGRGIEEGGAVEVKWAVDIDKHAIHSYRANLACPESVKLYLGSVNDYISQAMHGSHSEVIARRGEVEIIIGGSPCQGFSLINNSRGNESALRNMSLIASFAAFVDYYRPKYALLENVSTVAQCAEKNQKKNVFSQMLCAFAGMGYQVQQFHLDAWTFGSPQSRSRIFISIAAPGFVPMSPPQASHSHPYGIVNRTLGRAANGLPFSERVLGTVTPFNYITIGEATADLPERFDERTKSVRFPDHRLSRLEKSESRMRIACIPRYPRWSSLVMARAAGLLPKPLVEGHSAFWDHKLRSRPGTRAWTRISSDTLLPTVITKPLPNDAFTGRALHWKEDRCLTVLEVRRAQGFPDHEVIVGLPSAQFKIVGNSVPRTVALALGISLRNAWLANSSDQSLKTDIPTSAPIEALEPGKINVVDCPDEENKFHFLPCDEGNPEGLVLKEIRSTTQSISATNDRETMMIGLARGRSTTGKPNSGQVLRKSVASVALSTSSAEISTPSQTKALDTMSIRSDSSEDEEVFPLSFPQRSSTTKFNMFDSSTIPIGFIRSERKLAETTTIIDERLQETGFSGSYASSATTICRPWGKEKLITHRISNDPSLPFSKSSVLGVSLENPIRLD